MSNSNDNKGIFIRAGKMDLFNYALYQNGISPIRDVEILNKTGDTVEGLVVQVESETDMFQTFRAQLPPIPSGKPISLGDISLEVNGDALAKLTETIILTITLQLERDGKMICEQSAQMKVYAYNEWNLSYEYRVFYTKCYDKIDKLSDTTVQAHVLEGAAKVNQTVGRAMAKVPLIKKTSVDNVLIGAGRRLSEIGDSKTEELLDMFDDKNRDSGINLFIDNVNAMDQIFNQPKLVLLDDEAVYMKTYPA